MIKMGVYGSELIRRDNISQGRVVDTVLKITSIKKKLMWDVLVMNGMTQKLTFFLFRNLLIIL